MTKQQEIQTLRDAVAKLGNDSYCGPWLQSVIGEVEGQITSDFMPSPSILTTEKRCELELSAAKEQAVQILGKARIEADALRASARLDVSRIHSNGATTLRKAMELLA